MNARDWHAADTLQAYEEQAMELAEKNAVTDYDIVEEQHPTGIMRAPQQQAISTVSATPADLLRIAVESGADLDRLERLMALQERWEASEAKKAFHVAMSSFKSEPVEIFKRKQVGYTTKDGDFVGYKHAELSDVADAVGPAMAKHDLSYRWDVRQESGQITVTCIVTHVRGHSESVVMSAAPDSSGKKNPIQQVASAISYLQRYTLLSVTGMATKGMDDDGGKADQTADELEAQAKAQAAVDDWISKVKSSNTEQAVRDTWKIAAPALHPFGKDAHQAVKSAVESKIADFKAAQ